MIGHHDEITHSSKTLTFKLKDLISVGTIVSGRLAAWPRNIVVGYAAETNKLILFLVMTSFFLVVMNVNDLMNTFQVKWVKIYWMLHFYGENANNVTKLKAKKDQLIHINACFANPQIDQTCFV